MIGELEQQDKFLTVDQLKFCCVNMTGVFQSFERNMSESESFPELDGLIFNNPLPLQQETGTKENVIMGFLQRYEHLNNLFSGFISMLQVANLLK
ncbi:hypothetical protein Mgra_00009684 [Meloidogyne graminicola]|uniref:Uncharacterized protein n=1 Tax=Meloidogyne graminicola TaxID=189291 RepID=A0A8S9Z771_9BILA|nr:hypothetical protein Mgra_00009684 [Meloidogyne graminicola]KAF7626912.1 hypothetical protein Mgra_00009684 [Meloidogyne graminicola]